MEKIIFENLPSTKTPINATNLNLLQDNVEIAIDGKSEVVDTLDGNETDKAPSVRAVKEELNNKINEIKIKFLGAVNTGGSNSFSLTSPDLSEYNGCYLIVATKGADDGANSGVWFARSGFKAVAKVVSTGSSEIALDITKNGDTINGVFQGDMSYCYVRVYKI